MRVCKLLIVSISVLLFLFSPLGASFNNQNNQIRMNRRQIKKSLRIYRKSDMKLLTPPPVADILIGKTV
jgi:hypothetical protein